MQEFKLVLVGERGVGKHLWMEKLAQLPGFVVLGQEENSPIGVEIHIVVVWTNQGPIKLNIWIPVTLNMGAPRDNVYHQAQCAILMFDVTSCITYVPNWHRDLTRVCGNNIPIVLVRNKVDTKDRMVKAKQITFHRKKGIEYYDISAESNYNLEKPFLWLARMLSPLQLVEAPKGKLRRRLRETTTTAAAAATTTMIFRESEQRNRDRIWQMDWKLAAAAVLADGDLTLE